MIEAELPRLLLIADGFASGRANQSAAEVQRRTVRLVEAGLSFVQIRDHAAPLEAFAREASILVATLRSVRADVFLTVNSRPETARALNTGLHLGGRSAVVTDLSRERRKGNGASVSVKGYSAHTLSDIQTAISSGFDYATFSPIFETESHPNAKPLGLPALKAVCRSVFDFPVFALGGVTPEGTRLCLESGAYGVAVLSDLLDAINPLERVSLYRRAGVL